MLKEAFKQIKFHYFPKSFINKTESNINLPAFIKEKNQIIPKNKIDNYIEEQLKKLDDPLLTRINPQELNYINEYQKTLNKNRRLAHFLIKIGVYTEKDYWSLKSLPETYYLEPNYGSYFHEKHYFSRKIIFLFTILTFYFVGYVYNRLRYDFYFRKFAFAFFPTFVVKVSYLDEGLVSLEKFVDKYMPKELSDKELKFITYKLLNDWRIQKKFQRNLKKIDLNDREMLELDLLLKKMR